MVVLVQLHCQGWRSGIPGEASTGHKAEGGLTGAHLPAEPSGRGGETLAMTERGARSELRKCDSKPRAL